MAKTTSLSFTHTLGNSYPPSRVIDDSEEIGNYVGYSDDYLSYNSSKNWIAVDFYDDEDDFGIYDVNILESIDFLQSGNYTAELKIYHNVVGTFTSNRGDVKSTLMNTINISLTVLAAEDIGVSPSSMFFTGLFGGANPVTQTLEIQTENTWNISNADASWLTLSKTTGVGNDTVRIGVDINDLELNTYTTSIVVSDDFSTSVFPIELQVTDFVAGGSYLYLSTLALSFSSVTNETNESEQRIEFNSSTDWQATTNVAWLNLLTTSGSAGASFLDVALIDIEDIAVGFHEAEITITNSTALAVVTVSLVVSSFFEETLKEGAIYFTEENNLVQISSSNTFTKLKITGASNYNDETVNVVYTVPFFNSVAQQRIGSSLKRVFGKQDVINVSETAVLVPFNAIGVDFNVKEIEQFGTTVYKELNFNNILFLPGPKPTTNWLSNSATKFYVTKTGLVTFSFLIDTASSLDMEITGAVTTTIPFTLTDELFCTVVLQVSDFEVTTGDVLNIAINNHNITVVIKEEDQEQAFILWQNENGFFDCFELNGNYEEKVNFSQTEKELQKDYKTLEKTVLEIEDEVSYAIETGWIYSQDQVDTLHKMLRSSNLFLKYKGVITSINSVTKQLSKYKTNEFQKSYLLNFEKRER